MYQPTHGRFAVADPAALLTELAARVAATLVTSGEDGLRASVLPMLFEPGEGAHGILRGHLARPNPHWRELADGAQALAIFNGPEAYVTPSWYAEKTLTGKVVPTWNYTTVVVHGRVTVQHDAAWLLSHVRRLVDRHEAERADPWSLDDVPPGYAENQVRAIVGLELHVDRIEAKRKLSQNRSGADVDGVIAGLDAGSATERLVAGDMRRARREP